MGWIHTITPRSDINFSESVSILSQGHMAVEAVDPSRVNATALLPMWNVQASRAGRIKSVDNF